MISSTIDRLEGIFLEISRYMYEDTGLVVQCLAAGPEPKLGGKMAFFK